MAVAMESFWVLGLGFIEGHSCSRIHFGGLDCCRISLRARPPQCEARRCERLCRAQPLRLHHPAFRQPVPVVDARDVFFVSASICGCGARQARDLGNRKPEKDILAPFSFVHHHQSWRPRKTPTPPPPLLAPALLPVSSQSSTTPQSHQGHSRPINTV